MASNSLKIPRLNVEESAQDKVLGGVSSNQSQGDDFEYDRIAKDPGEERTKRRDTDPPPSDTSRPPVMTTTAALHDDDDGSFAQTSAYIYQKKMGGWNARIPEVDIEEQETPRTSEVKRTSMVEQSSTMKLKLDWNIKDSRTKRQKLTLLLGQEPIIRSRSTNCSRRPGLKDTSFSASASVRIPQGYQAHSRPNDAVGRGGSRGRPSLQLQSLTATGRRDPNGGLPSRGHVSPTSPVDPSRRNKGAAELQLTHMDDNGQPHESDFVVAPHVLWCHVKDKHITLDKLLDEVRDCRAHGLTESEYGLTKRLKAKLETISERNFVGGRYLEPLTLRYDSQDVSKYSVDKTCIFFNFPYLCVAPKSLRQYKEAGDPAHPARTLLQSHYHLNKTTDRDNLQCITWLQPGKLRKYITAVGRDNTPGLSRNASSLMGLRSKLKQWHSLVNQEEIFYVPQYWGLIVGLDNLITSSTCGDEDLRGGRIALSRDAIHDRATSFSLLRILFYRKHCLEELVFPLDQCDSYFGLLNKQQRILELLDEDENLTTERDDHGTLAGEMTGTKTIQSQQEAIRNPKDHPLWRDDDGQRITLANWVSIVEAARDKEVLTLRMQPKMPHLAMVCGHDESTVDTKDSNNPVFGTPLARVITPFLQWPMLDEFGDRENSSTSVSRVSKFLRAIELHLPIKNRMTAQERARNPQHASERRSQAKSAVHISPQNLESLQEDSEAVCQEFEVAKLLLERSVELLGLFIDSEMLKSQCRALEIYWGAVYQILLVYPAPTQSSNSH